MLICPICKEELSKQVKQLKCDNNHSFDIAKQGYTNLLVRQSSKIKGDSKEMLQAREYIQNKGFYQELSDAIIDSISPYKKEALLDIGCGIGYYTSNIEKTYNNQIIGIDIAKDALKIASRTNKEITYIVASNSELPVKDQSIDMVVNIFSPIYEEEAVRVLKNDGVIVVVSPNENHLIEMKEVIYDSIIKKDEHRNLLHHSSITLLESKDIEYIKTVQKEELEKLFLMTPHYWTSSIKGKERLAQISSIDLTFDFNISIYKIN